MEDVLIALVKFCETGEPASGDAGTGLNMTPSVKRIDPPAKGADDTVAIRRSYEKVCDILDAVRRDQYVSFIQ